MAHIYIYILRVIAQLLAFMFLCTAAWSETRDLPTTPQFMNILNACAAGSKTSFQGDLLGSVKNIYEGQRSRGFAELKTETDFLRMLPEKQKFEGYRLYIECIKAIFNDPVASKSKVQSEFLAQFTKDTPIEKVAEIFGGASKMKQLYGENGRILDQGTPVILKWFEGVKVKFIVASGRGGRLLGVGVYAKEDASKANIPYMHMGNAVDGQQRDFHTLGDFQFGWLSQLCDIQELEGGHARFQYVSTPQCYFGAPGGYMNFQFVFQPTGDIHEQCNVDFTSKIVLSKIRCQLLKKLKPDFAFVFFHDDVLPEEISDTIMEWIYDFAQ
jgi:hypothetical protein